MVYNMNSSFFRVCRLPLCYSLSAVSRRLFSSAESRPGKYAQVTEDVVFKRIMHKDGTRNSFLGAVLGQPVFDSKILDTSLNPIKQYQNLRKVINTEGIEAVMAEISSGVKQPKVTNKTTKRPLPRLETFLVDLAHHYNQLSHAIPSAERNTQLDIYCETKDGLVNIEVQVEPQNYWDIRILSHVCGIFQKQFPRSFAWKSLENDPNISSKVRRVIGISIFEKAPVYQGNVKERLPWYNSKPWLKEEVSRHFVLADVKNPKVVMHGVEFYDFNLQGVFSLNPRLSEESIELQEWLEFFAKAHLKQPEEIKILKTPELIEAYQMAEIDRWDEKIKTEYRDQQIKRHNISHYVEGENKRAKEEGREEGKEEGREEGREEENNRIAIKMIKLGMKDEDVMNCTQLSLEQLKNIMKKQSD